MPAPNEHFVISGPEALLGVRPVELGAERVELTMESGSWLLDGDAGRCRGALAIPLDDATGHVVAAGAADGRWPVSLGIRIDFLGDPPTDGPPMSVHGDLVVSDGRGGTTRGAVIDAAGRPVALVTQRSHLIAVESRPRAAVAFDLPARGTSVRDAFGFRSAGTGVVELPPSTLAANAMGNVHGGVLICGSEFAAMSAVRAAGRFRTMSVDIAYVRPGDASGLTTFRAEVVHRGRSVAVLRVLAADAADKTCAIATVVVQH